MAYLVNGGKKYSPSLTYTVGKDVQLRPEGEDIGLNPAHLKFIRRAMASVVNHPRGTAYASSLSVGGKKMGGKTGTVQVRRISLAERESGILKDNELPYHLRDHALFVGYAPLDRPLYAIAVVVEHGGSGSAVAAPIARKVMRETLKRNPSALDVFVPVA